MKKLVFLLIVMLFVSGCSISFKTQKSQDLGVFKSEDGGESWQQKVAAGRSKNKEIRINNVSVKKILFDPHNPETIYLITLNNGVYRSDDMGELWYRTALSQGAYVNLVFDPKDPNIMYTAKEGKILKSENAGDKWKTVYLEGEPQNVITDLAIDHFDPKRIFAVTNQGSMLSSENYGLTWKVLKWFNKPFTEIVIDPSDSRIIYLLTKNKGFIRTLDKGESFKSISKPLRKFKDAIIINYFHLYPRNTSVIYLATNYGILKSTDRGDSFQRIKTLLKFGNSIDSVIVEPRNSDVIYFTKANKLHKSVNNGKDWKTLTIPSSNIVNQIVIPKDEPETLYIGMLKIKK